tara:strand:+ start:5244 stop:5378 length:135 start_codon:yes stop_codon:yes gene_type:complete
LLEELVALLNIETSQKIILRELKVVGREGFEPSTNWLKANCSTN